MPIYEFRCSSCGHQQEFLQKVSDAPPTRCTQCGQETFSKMVTAAGFQLKGSGWYATDFKSGGSKSAGNPGNGQSEGAKSGSEKSESGKSESGKSESGKSESGKSESSSESKDSSKSSAPAGGSGACPACP